VLEDFAGKEVGSLLFGLMMMRVGLEEGIATDIEAGYGGGE